MRCLWASHYINKFHWSGVGSTAFQMLIVTTGCGVTFVPQCQAAFRSAFTRRVWGEMPEKPLTFCLRGWIRAVQGSEIGSLHCPYLTTMFLQCTGAFSPRSGLTSIQKKPPDFSASVRGLRIILLILRACWDSETSVGCSPRISPARGLHLVPGCLATS